MGLRAASAVLALALLAGCGGNDGGSGSIGRADGGVPANDGGAYGNLTGISLSQTDVRIPRGTSTAFAVTVTYSDGTRADLTPQAEARSSNPSVATVEKGPGSQIQIHAIGQGSSTITVTVAQFTQTCAVTVTQ